MMPMAAEMAPMAKGGGAQANNKRARAAPMMRK